jgi:hypothetical protein
VLGEQVERAECPFTSEEPKGENAGHGGLVVGPGREPWPSALKFEVVGLEDTLIGEGVETWPLSDFVLDGVYPQRDAVAGGRCTDLAVVHH